MSDTPGGAYDGQTITDNRQSDGTEIRVRQASMDPTDLHGTRVVLDADKEFSDGLPYRIASISGVKASLTESPTRTSAPSAASCRVRMRVSTAKASL